jgi:hypothetical protein
MMRNGSPALNMPRAAKAVRASPPPVYLKESCRYDRSATVRLSRVSLFKNTSTPTIVPTTVAYKFVKWWVQHVGSNIQL